MTCICSDLLDQILCSLFPFSCGEKSICSFSNLVILH
uniref:Uncharacterized protein n=1 Tax=Arundo donax TaxID=35708 RepID=A0A0A8ZC68_ARUDO